MMGPGGFLDFSLFDPAPRVVAGIASAFVAGTALTLGVALALRFAPKMNAATRYGVWWLTLATVVLLPFAGANRTGGWSPSSKVDLSAPRAFPVPVAPDSVRDRPGATTSLGTGDSPLSEGLSVRAADSPMSPFSLRLPGWLSGGPVIAGLGLLWLLAAGAGFGRLAIGFVNLTAIKRRSTSLPPALERRLGDLIASGPNAVRDVRLALSEEIGSPATAGLVDPAILFPDALTRTLREDEINQVALHEMAHLRRFDDWTKLGQKLAESVFFFHPAVQYIGSRLDLEREMACDDWVVARTGEAHDYARFLTRIAELTSLPAPLALGITERKSHLARRIEMLLDQTRNARPRFSRWGLALAATALAALALFALGTSPVVAVAAAPPAPLPARAPRAPRPAPAPGPAVIDETDDDNSSEMEAPDNPGSSDDLAGADDDEITERADEYARRAADRLDERLTADIDRQIASAEQASEAALAERNDRRSSDPIIDPGTRDEIERALREARLGLEKSHAQLQAESRHLRAELQAQLGKIKPGELKKIQAEAMREARLQLEASRTQIDAELRAHRARLDIEMKQLQELREQLRTEMRRARDRARSMADELRRQHLSIDSQEEGALGGVEGEVSGGVDGEVSGRVEGGIGHGARERRPRSQPVPDPPAPPRAPHARTPSPGSLPVPPIPPAAAPPPPSHF